jgi:hypothetical protein
MNASKITLHLPVCASPKYDLVFIHFKYAFQAYNCLTKNRIKRKSLNCSSSYVSTDKSQKLLDFLRGRGLKKQIIILSIVFVIDETPHVRLSQLSTPYLV